MTYDHRFDRRSQMCGTERFKHYGALLPMEEPSAWERFISLIGRVFK